MTIFQAEMNFDAWQGDKVPPPGNVPMLYVEDRAVQQTTKQGAKGARSHDSGNVAWQPLYAPFGKITITTATIENNIRFPGQYYDIETGLHYNWNRYYDPKTGRYLTPDPIGLAGGVNLYGYTENDPVNKMDPEGLQMLNPAQVEVAVKAAQAAIAAGIAYFGAKAVQDTAEAINKATPATRNDECNRGKCKPCIPPVGTIAGDVNYVPPSRPHWPLTGDHVHWYKMNQTPYPECRCFWKRNYTKPTSGSSLPPGVPQVAPAAGGGPM